MATADGRQEILNWYHLVENLYQVGGSLLSTGQKL